MRIEVKSSRAGARFVLHLPQPVPVAAERLAAIHRGMAESGLDLVARVREERPEVRSLVVSCHDDAETVPA